MIVIAPAAVLVASKPVFRFAPFAAALVLLLAGSGDFGFALDRVAEIGLGCGIGVLVSLLVLPERATAVLVDHAAAILEALGAFAVVLLVENDPAARQRLEWNMRNAFAQLQNDLKEVQHERSVLLLRSDPFPEQLVRHLQRLRTDVNMLGAGGGAGGCARWACQAWGGDSNPLQPAGRGFARAHGAAAAGPAGSREAGGNGRFANGFCDRDLAA